MAALRAILIDKRSPFLGEACALCKHPFSPGEEIVICPEDATRHHVHCWRAYGNRCTAYGCTGHGEVVEATPAQPRPAASPGRVRPAGDEETKVRTLPATGFHCAQSCLVIAIAVAIVFFSIGCFGLWAIADYIMLEVLHWSYRPPFPGLLPPLTLTLSLLLT
ncbi:MAG: hypothetical protein L0331_25520 [Chloroflexi bacterium]|nr:hypothetical protein [Chloroflexota bacterium]